MQGPDQPDSAGLDSGASREVRKRRNEPTPAQRALGLLTRREHSRQELARKLVARGVAIDDAHEAVVRMAASGWQDDVRFACSLARTRAGSGHGPLRIRAELASHGLGDAPIVAAFAALADAREDDWMTKAESLLQRRFGARTADPATARKAADFLLRRGFDGDCVRAALRSLKSRG